MGSHQQQARQSNGRARYVFPVEPPVVELTEDEMKAHYGIPDSELPRHVRQSISTFARWSMAPINTQRSGAYSSAVQTATMDKYVTVIRGYLGWNAIHRGVDVEDLSLALYADPEKFMAFIGFIIARGTARAQLTKQVSVARKVNDYLQSGAPATSAARQHAKEMDIWLQTLSGQLYASAAVTTPEPLPDHGPISEWAKNLTATALDRVGADMDFYGHLTTRTAKTVSLHHLFRGLWALVPYTYTCAIYMHWCPVNMSVLCNDTCLLQMWTPPPLPPTAAAGAGGCHGDWCLHPARTPGPA